MSKSLLIDSNILIYALNKSSPYHKESKRIIDKTLDGKVKAYLTPQVLFELFAVITDSKKFPTPLSPSSAYSLIENNYLGEKFPLIHSKETTWEKTFDLAKQYQISSQDIFDVTLVATMIDNNILCIVSYDLTNFQKFPFLEVVHPNEVDKLP